MCCFFSLERKEFDLLSTADEETVFGSKSIKRIFCKLASATNVLDTNSYLKAVFFYFYFLNMHDGLKEWSEFLLKGLGKKHPWYLWTATTGNTAHPSLVRTRTG